MHLGMERVSHCTPRYEKVYDPSTYKVVFFSSAPIGIPFLEKMIDDKRFDVIGVVTMPDAPSGRGMKMKENVIKLQATSHKLQAKTPHSLTLTSKKYKKETQTFHTRLTQKDPDFIIVIAYGKIIPQSILDIPHFWPINIHWSLLPKYRGASPLQSVFLNNEKESGITIMHMNDKLDEGDILETKEIPLDLDMTAKDLISKMQELGPKFLLNTLWKWGKWRITPQKQEDRKATLCWKINKEDGLINPYQDSLEKIYNKYRAYILRPKIYFTHHDKRVIIEEIVIDKEKYKDTYDDPLLNIASDKQRDISPLHPAIKKIIIKPEGKKKMNWQEFERGYMKK